MSEGAKLSLTNLQRGRISHILLQETYLPAPQENWLGGKDGSVHFSPLFLYWLISYSYSETWICLLTVSDKAPELRSLNWLRFVGTFLMCIGFLCSSDGKAVLLFCWFFSAKFLLMMASILGKICILSCLLSCFLKEKHITKYNNILQRITEAI